MICGPDSHGPRLPVCDFFCNFIVIHPIFGVYRDSGFYTEKFVFFIIPTYFIRIFFRLIDIYPNVFSYCTFSMPLRYNENRTCMTEQYDNTAAPPGAVIRTAK